MACILQKKLAEHPLVAEVLHPGLPNSCDHEIYKRDFSGPCGLFAFVIKRR